MKLQAAILALAMSVAPVAAADMPHDGQPPLIHEGPPHAVKLPWDVLVQRALAHGGQWSGGCYWSNCAYALQWIGEDGGVRRLMRIEWFRWFQPNAVQLLGCEIQPDTVLHCKDYVTNADSYWTVGFDGAYHGPQ
jgi:hypothetical protein